MTTPTAKPGSPPPSTTIREEEQADAAKTADDAPAPMHADRERRAIVRDAYGNDPYGEPEHPAEVGTSPYELPDPLVAALEATKPHPEKK